MRYAYGTRTVTLWSDTVRIRHEYGSYCTALGTQYVATQVAIMLPASLLCPVHGSVCVRVRECSARVDQCTPCLCQCGSVAHRDVSVHALA